MAPLCSHCGPPTEAGLRCPHKTLNRTYPVIVCPRRRAKWPQQTPTPATLTRVRQFLREIGRRGGHGRMNNNTAPSAAVSIESNLRLKFLGRLRCIGNDVGVDVELGSYPLLCSVVRRKQ